MVDQTALSTTAQHPGLPSFLTHPSLNNSLAIVPQNQSLSGWFVGDPSTSGLDPARQAFEDAVTEFRKDVSKEETTRWLNGSTTIFDVEQAVIAAKKKYEKRSPNHRAKRWLASCSSRLMHYSVVMDTLAQHHPEYVSLAWGAIKFLFIAVLNHEELLTEISKTIAKIADVLPRADLSSNLFPTQRMKVAVAQLYAKVMYFVQDAVKWYKKGKLAHSVSAVFKPYALGFKAIVEEISEASRRVDQEAAAASRAEIRELHIKLQHFAQLSMNHFSTQSLATTNITSLLTHQTTLLHQQQLHHLTSTPTLSQLPSATDTLSYCRSIRTRRRTQFLISPSQISLLRNWHSSTSPSTFPILTCRGRGHRTLARDFAVSLLDILVASSIPTIWALSSPHTSSETQPQPAPTLTSIILSLAVQVLALNPSAMHSGSNPITASHFHSAATLTTTEALALFSRSLTNLPTLYMIIDMSLIQTAVDYNPHLASGFIQSLLDTVLMRSERGIKLIIAAEEFDNGLEIEEQDALEENSILVVGKSPGPAKRKGASRGMTKYSSHVFPMRGGAQEMGTGNWLSSGEGERERERMEIS